MQGFFYNKFPEPKKGDLGTETDINLNQQLCYHVLGQPQSKDAVVWACSDHPAWMLGAEVTDDGRCCSLCVCLRLQLCSLPLAAWCCFSAAYLDSSLQSALSEKGQGELTAQVLIPFLSILHTTRHDMHAPNLITGLGPRRGVYKPVAQQHLSLRTSMLNALTVMMTGRPCWRV